MLEKNMMTTMERKNLTTRLLHLIEILKKSTGFGISSINLRNVEDGFIASSGEKISQIGN